MKLTILSTSDTHGFVFPTNYVKPNANMPFGLIRAASVIHREQQAATGPVITVDNGDFLAGSPLGLLCCPGPANTRPAAADAYL